MDDSNTSMAVETKQLIRSLLESSPFKIYSNEVEREFLKIMGYELPFRKLGFTTCEEYLKSIPDTVTICHTSSGPLVRSVATSETKHIDRLVTTQRNTSGRCRQVRKERAMEPQHAAFGNSWSVHPTNTPLMNYSQVPQPFNERQPLLPHPAFSKPTPVPYPSNDFTPYLNPQRRLIAHPPLQDRNLYTIIMNNIVALLMQHPNGMRLDDLYNNVEVMFNMPRCHNHFGYPSFIDMLSAMGYFRFRNAGNCIIVLLPQIPKMPTQSPATRLGQNNSPLRHVQTVDQVLVQTKPAPATPPLQTNKEVKEATDKQNKYSNLSQHSSSSPISDHQDNYSKDMSYEKPIEERDSSRQQILQELQTPSHIIGDQMKAVFLQILEQNPNGVAISSLSSEYQKITKHRLDFRELGFYSALELVVSLPDVFTLRELPDRGEFLLLPAQSKSSDSCDLVYSSQPSDTTEISKQSPKTRIAINKELERKLLQVICSCPEGVLLEDFEAIYFDFHDEKLNFDRLNYTPEALFLALPSIVTLDYTDDRTVVVRATPEGERILGQLGSRPDLSHFLPWNVANDAAISSSIKFMAQQLPNLSPEEKFIELYVPYIAHPGKFWIQLRGLKTSVELDKLMKQLKQTYYSSISSKKYFMPPHLIREGHVCAALYAGDQNWHRAVIVNVDDKAGEVEVYYVDFGNCGFVSRTDIRLLKMKFMELPGQAIAAKLAGIVPYRGSLWTAEAVRRFRHLCMDRPLYGSLISRKDGCLSLCLYDTSGDTDIRINDTLVSECHATLSFLQPPTLQAGQVLGRTTDLTSLKSSTPPPVAAIPIEASTPEPPVHNCVDFKINASGDTSIPEDSSISMGKCWNIIPITLQDHKFNVVFYNEHFYVPSFDISALFWSYDSLFQMLTVLRIKVDYVYMRKATHPECFESLLEAFLRSKCISTPTVTSIMLCPVTQVPHILLAISEKTTDLAASFNNLSQQ